MNNDQLNSLISGLGMLTELWTITFHGFKQQGLSDPEATMHTKSLMSIMMDSVINGNENKE